MAIFFTISIHHGSVDSKRGEGKFSENFRFSPISGREPFRGFPIITKKHKGIPWKSRKNQIFRGAPGFDRTAEKEYNADWLDFDTKYTRKIERKFHRWLAKRQRSL